MLHGNFLLHGWTVTDVSFYTTELPEYMLVELMRGLGAADLHIAAALTYTLLVLLAGLVAKGRATGTEGLVRVLIASGIMIAPQLHWGTLVLLTSPDHTGTGVPLLVIWLVLEAAPRRWYTPPVIGLLLTWALLGDRIAELLGVAPLVLVCAVRVYQGRVQRGTPLREHWYEVSLIAAAVGSYAVADIAYKVIAALGGFHLEPVKANFGSVAQMSGNLWRTVDGVLALYGAEFFSMPAGIRAVFALLHLVGVAMAATAVWAGARLLLRPRAPHSADPDAPDPRSADPRSGDLVVGVLTVGLLLNLAAYAFSTMPVSPWSTREIAGILPAGAVLAGRLLAGPVIRARLQPALALVGAGYLAALGYGAAQPQQPAVTQNLAGWLQSHHLRYGLSGYGFGPVTTLASHGNVDLRQAAFRPGKAGPGPEEYHLSWYDAKKHDATFLVLATTPASPDPLTAAEARRIFGRPAHVYRYTGQYVIWTYGKNLLSGFR